MDYYTEIKNRLIDNEIYSKVKDYSKERHRVLTYFEIGKILNEAGSKYGDNIIDDYSRKLIVEVGKKYNRRTLFRMKQFYKIFNNEKVSPLATQLTWSHYSELLTIKDESELLYYINLVNKNTLSKRELREKIKNNEYKRLPDITKNKLINKEKLNIEDTIPNPIIIKTNNKEVISEKILQSIILEDIPSFLKELGNGFTFIDNEYKIKIGERYNYIDLLLYNYIYNSFVVVELKVTEMKKEYIGQIEVYMNYIDKHIKRINQDKTIGIIMCKKNNELIIEYASDNRIYQREYKLV